MQFYYKFQKKYMQNRSKGRENDKKNVFPKTASKIPKPPLKETTTAFPFLKSSGKGSRGSIQKTTVTQTSIKPGSSVQKPKNQPLKKYEPPKRPVTYSKPNSTGSKFKEKQNKKQSNWSRLPLNLLLSVADYCCVVAFDVYKISLVCSTWRKFMECENAIFFWKRFSKTSGAGSFEQYKNCMIQDLQAVKQKKSLEFESIFTKLFNYGSTKENIPNKLISKLKLQMEVTINNKKYGNYKYKLRHFNFSSYIYAKITELSQIPFDMYTPHNMFKDKLSISIKFYSRTYKVSHQLNYQFLPEQIAECAIKQKAFNYFLAKNLIITFFQGDNTFLYSFLEISVLQLITQFRKIIKQNFQEHIDKKTKKLPMYKKLCETQFQDFLEYLKYQADFQLHMSYHNSLQQIFTHCDTKVYPIEYDKKKAYFEVKIQDTFAKTSTFLLDNKMGMSEQIQDLYLLDFVLKDRDRFIIVFSGFIYARKASQKQRESIGNYFDFSELPIKILEFKGKGYDCSIMVIEEKKKNLIKWARFSIYP